MREQLERIYKETQITKRKIKRDNNNNNINVSFANGAKVEITGINQTTYHVQFINHETGELIYEDRITTNHWCKPYIEYYIPWEIKVFSDGELVNHTIMNLKDMRVLIIFDSNAIGDTVAWFPAVEEFRKKHQCKLIVSTFKNSWFKDNYPEIEFAERGVVVDNCFAIYKIGWFYNEDGTFNKSLNPVDFKKRPLQATSTDILGLPHSEIRPLISVPNEKTKISGKYVVIAPHASAHAKYWNHPNGWQNIINYLHKLGYKVVMITSEKLGDKWHDSKISSRPLYNITNKTGARPITERMVDIRDAELFIGVGSGLSWLSWAIGTKTVLISGFSEPYSEFSDCYRVYNNKPNICTGCFNRSRLNAGDWEWCPEHKNTPRMFECSKTITPDEVIVAINKALGI